MPTRHTRPTRRALPARFVCRRTVHASQERRHKRNHGPVGEAAQHSIKQPLPFTPPRTRPDPSQPADRWHTRLSWCLRLGMVLFALASLGLCIWGMTTVRDQYVQTPSRYSHTTLEHTHYAQCSNAPLRSQPTHSKVGICAAHTLKYVYISTHSTHRRSTQRLLTRLVHP